MSFPLNSTSPPVMIAGGRKIRRIAWATVDFPQPDSPASPNTSPGAMEKETPSTALTDPPGVKYSTLRVAHVEQRAGFSAGRRGWTGPVAFHDP